MSKSIIAGEVRTFRLRLDAKKTAWPKTTATRGEAMNDLTNRELCMEIKAIRDLAQRLADKMDELNFRLNERGSSMTDTQRLPAWITTGRRDDEDDGSD